MNPLTASHRIKLRSAVPKEEMAPNVNPAVFEAMMAKGTPVFQARVHISQLDQSGQSGFRTPDYLEREQMTAIESY
jgi:hypothetical protein